MIFSEKKSLLWNNVIHFTEIHREIMFVELKILHYSSRNT